MTSPETAARPSADGAGGWVAARIRARLGYLGMTNADLARAMGITRQAVSRRLRDQPPFPWTVLELGLVAQVLGLPLAALLDADPQVAGPQLLAPLTRPTRETN